MKEFLLTSYKRCLNSDSMLIFLTKVVITWSRFARMKLQPVQPELISPYDYIGNQISSKQGGKVLHLVLV